MGEMTRPNPALVAEAIVVWTGWGRAAWPLRDESVLVDHFGAEAAAELMPLVRELEDDFYSSEARHQAGDLREMGKMATTQFRMKHPDLATEAVEALSWCYTYDYK
jgi:hypothetical protein